MPVREPWGVGPRLRGARCFTLATLGDAAEHLCRLDGGSGVHPGGDVDVGTMGRRRLSDREIAFIQLRHAGARGSAATPKEARARGPGRVRGIATLAPAGGEGVLSGYFDAEHLAAAMPDPEKNTAVFGVGTCPHRGGARALPGMKSEALPPCSQPQPIIRRPESRSPTAGRED